MKLHLVEIGSGQEVLGTLQEYAKEAGIQQGAIASLVGAISSCTLSNMPKNDAQSDILTTLEQPMEMSGTGEINGGVPHIHCVVTGEGNAAVAGHLHEAWVDTWFVRIYVAAMD